MAESVVLFFVGSRCKCVSVGKNGICAADLKQGAITDGQQDLRDFYLTCDGRKLGDDCVIRPGKCVWLVPRVVGGKGGFGSMLRAIGAQIEKTTNREACRDLSGRRLRDINEEKRLKKWIAKQADAERGREQRRKERLARMLVVPKHEFDDPNYYKQRSDITGTVEDALSQGLSAGSSGTAEKREANFNNKPAKRVKLWTNVEDEHCSSSGTDKDSSCSSEDQAMECSSEDSDSSRDEDSIRSNEATEEKQIGDTADKIVPEVKGDINVSGHDSIADKAKSLENVSTAQDQKDELHSEIVKDSPTEVKQPSSHSQWGPLDVERFDSAAELEKLGLEQLKFALAERSMKCGGTLQERAKRLFSIKGLDAKDINPNLLAKPIKKQERPTR